MKLMKQPFFYIGIGSLLCAIAIAIVSSMINPSVSVINKFEKALNKGDSKLLEKCYSPTVDKELFDTESVLSEMESVFSMLGIKGKITYEILAGEVVEEEDEDGNVTKTVPTVFVAKVGDQVIEISAEDMELFTESGKDYLYTGYEQVENEDGLTIDFDTDYDFDMDYDFEME